MSALLTQQCGLNTQSRVWGQLTCVPFPPLTHAQGRSSFFLSCNMHSCTLGRNHAVISVGAHGVKQQVEQLNAVFHILLVGMVSLKA